MMARALITILAAFAAHATASSLPETAIARMTPKMGLVLALYNANTTTDWVTVAAAARRVPITAIVPVEGVSPPDPDWVPEYPADPAAYREGVAALRAAGAQVYAYAHLRNISRPCCTCCGNLTQFKGWVDAVADAATFDGMMLDNLDAPWSAAQPYHPDGYHEMFVPAARLVRARGMKVIANGPHVAHNGSTEAAAPVWQPYLDLAPSLTTLFEMPLDDWRAVPPGTDFSAALNRSAATLGGYVLDIPDTGTSSGGAAATRAVLDDVLQLAVQRGLGWLYPTIACKHSNGTHRGSCTYATLPKFWDSLIAAIEHINSSS